MMNTKAQSEAVESFATALDGAAAKSSAVALEGAATEPVAIQRDADESERAGGFLRQVFMYYGVSIAQTFVEFGVFALMKAFGLAVDVSNGIAVACSGSFNFLMNRNITFKASSNFWRSVALFVLLYVWNFLFGTWFIDATSAAFGWPQMAGKLITMVMQGVWGFCLCKWVIFR